MYFIAVLDFFTGSLPTWMIERVREGYWQVPGGGPQSRDIPRHLPESIHRQASQRSCTSQRLGRLLLSTPRICQVSPSGTSLSFLPRARHHISHPLNPPERHFFHQIPSPPLSPTSHFPTINISTFEQPTPTHPISPHPRRLALRLFTFNHQQPLLPLLTLSKCRAPAPTFPPAAKLPRDGPRPSHQPLRPPAEIAPPLRLSTVTSMVTMAMATANFPRYHSLTPPLLSHSQGTFGQDTLTCPSPPDPDANQSPFRLAGGAGARAR